MAPTEIPSPVSPIRPSEGRPESPTTARPLDFDSDQETGTVAAGVPPKADQSTQNKQSPVKEPEPPAKPPRPLTAQEQAENTLKEAFPTIDANVVRAVLRASGGNVEPAFNALLGMTDPDSQQEPEPAPPAKPPRPTTQQTTSSTKLSQLEADEIFARQLAEHYSGTDRPPAQHRASAYNEHLAGSRVGRPGASPNPDDVPWRSFIDDDLPEIRDNIRKGFIETQNTVNKWITSFKKKIDGEEDDADSSPPPVRPDRGFDRTRGATNYAPPARRSSEVRRSADLQRYDADMQPIGDDFSKLELRDGEAPPRVSSRPLANPNLFRSGADARSDRRPSPGTTRKVSFQDGPPEEIKDLYSASPKPSSVTPASAPGSTSKSSKWQPLTTVDPSPVADNDPFSLGDSDDEKDAKVISLQDDEAQPIKGDGAGATASTSEDETVKKATDEAMKDSIGK